MHCKTHRWRSDERQGSTFPMHVRIRFQVAFLLVHSALLVLLLKILQQRRLCIHGINEMHAPGWTLWWVRPWTCNAHIQRVCLSTCSCLRMLSPTPFEGVCTWRSRCSASRYMMQSISIRPVSRHARAPSLLLLSSSLTWMRSDWNWKNWWEMFFGCQPIITVCCVNKTS